MPLLLIFLNFFLSSKGIGLSDSALLTLFKVTTQDIEFSKKVKYEWDLSNVLAEDSEHIGQFLHALNLIVVEIAARTYYEFSINKKKGVIFQEIGIIIERSLNLTES